MIKQDDCLRLLESLAETLDDHPEAGEFLQEWLYDRLREEPHPYGPPPLRCGFDDFIRLLLLLVDYDAPPFTLHHVEIWLRHWIRDASLTRSQMDLIFDMAPIDATDLSCVRKQTSATLLEACRARWPTEPGPDMDRLCDSLSALYVAYAPRVLWDVVASHTAVYVAYMARAVATGVNHLQKTEWIRLARRRWRLKRVRVAARAVAAGAAMWRLYQSWALHPARLHIASSALSATVAASRAAMADTAAPADPAFPVAFRLVAVADYFAGRA